MIPDFNLSNVIPPFVGDPIDRRRMSPYSTSMMEFVKKFSTSPERRRILSGLLAYRERLIDLGFSDGWQWLDGSFAMNVEVIHGRPPRDVDVVTFARFPNHLKKFNDDEWDAFISSNQELFTPKLSKDRFHCDAYFISLDKPAELLVDDTRYFFGLFSHRRNPIIWKGMLSIPLSSNDAEAKAFLDEGRQPC